MDGKAKIDAKAMANMGWLSGDNTIKVNHSEGLIPEANLLLVTFVSEFLENRVLLADRLR